MTDPFPGFLLESRVIIDETQVSNALSSFIDYYPFCAHSLCQGTNVLESPEYCVEIFLFAEQSVQYRHARRLF